jgi:hypothetical protein
VVEVGKRKLGCLPACGRQGEVNKRGILLFLIFLVVKEKTASLRRSERLILKLIPIAIGVNSNTKKNLPYFWQLEFHFDLWWKKNCVSASQREINIQIHSDSYRDKLKFKKKPALLLAVGISL